DEPQQFLDGVARAKQYIVDGDVFQVNLSRGWDVSLAQGTATDVYAALRIANPAPFSAYLDLGAAGQIVSSSPERLVQVKDGIVQTRPIAGTFARSLDPIEDEKLKQRLLDTPKERAEHIMLVDLERNDLGRIAVPGTVKVDELMAVATYSFVHHIESNIRAVLRDGLNTADVLRALFPGGTITGCPKVRCMQIIRELEDRPRLAYTGSLGYINRDGSMDSNILIRTFVQRGVQLYFRAGAGVVADSDAERELQETRHKARGLLRALGVQG
ncbi:MAG: chorismate-binding protein, partial [Deefgea sp.]